MDPVTLLVLAIAKGLTQVGTELLRKGIVAPALEPATERLKKWIQRPYRRAEEDQALRKAVREALEQVGVPTDDEDEVVRWLKVVGLDRLQAERDDGLRRQVARGVLALADPEDDPPEDLLTALRWPCSRKRELAAFLAALRARLFALEDWRPPIEYADRATELGMLRELLSTVTESGAGPAVRVRPVPPPEREIEERYLRSLVDAECRFLPLAGRDPRASTPSGLPMRLEQVYIALNTTERSPQAREEMHISFGVAEDLRRESLSALRIFLDYSHLVLLGAPGSGKTTFAEHLALCLAGERLEPGSGWAERLATHNAAWEGPAPLPIRIRLRHFAADTECLPAAGDAQGRAEHLLAYVEKVSRQGHYGENFPEHALACLDRGDALLILDGLDEVVDPVRREQVAAAIADLASRRCRQARFLVTCRVRQYPLDDAGRPAAPWVLPGFHIATLADFDRDQIERFIEAWFGELCALGRFSEEERNKRIGTLKEAIERRPDLQEIAPRPIILTQMALVHDLRGKLPGTRVKLYEECADLLLWTWEQLRARRAGRRETADDFINERMNVPGLQRGHLQRALDHAVFDAHAAQGSADEGPTDIPEETLRRRLTECLARTGLSEHEAEHKAQFFIDEYLRYRNGLIVPAGERTFQTPHRTLQEFLAARRLQSQREFDRDAPRLVKGNYDLWREVFLLAVGQVRLGDGVDAVDILCPRRWPDDEEGWRLIVLAGQGLVEIGPLNVRSDERGPEVLERIESLLRRTAHDLDSRGRPSESLVPVRIRYAAAETLDRLDWLPDDLNGWLRCPGCAEGGGDLMAMKYPVTNAQFERFVQAGGYENREWWSEEGWRWRMEGHRVGWRGEGPVTEPEYWRHPRFGRERRGYPVVGVSWYEAEAYCRWLTDLLGRAREGDPELEEADRALVADLLAAGAEEVRLPAGGEWVAMAGGEEEDRYPWDPPGGPATGGEAAVLARANVREAGLGGTSPVGMYPLGASHPFGLMDLAGNVWEWLDGRVVRGGSWFYLRGGARCAGRDRYAPDLSDFGVGFRCVSPVPGSGF